MSLETTITDIIARLRQGRFPNEQALSQGIILRVLQKLGWNTRAAEHLLSSAFA
jgi:predicted type IV restriction endonuclease